MSNKSLVRLGIATVVIAVVGAVAIFMWHSGHDAYKKVRTGTVYGIDRGTLVANGLLEKTGISKEESPAHPPALLENWTFSRGTDGKVKVTGKASIRFEGVATWEIAAAQTQELDGVDTPWGTLYVGRLDGSVVTKKGSEMLTMKVIYKPETDQIKINAVVGTVGNPLMLQFGESFVSEQELYSYLAEKAH